MLTVEKVETGGWEPALRGMRNPLNSWGKGDSTFADVDWLFRAPSMIEYLGDNDRSLMKRLLNAGGNEHCKFRRMIAIWCDVVAPLYWWKQFDTYHVGTVTNSCSTMHTLTKEPLTIEMFSTDGLLKGDREMLEMIVAYLEKNRRLHVDHVGYAKEYQETRPDLSSEHRDQAQGFWNGLVKILPESFNQRRTVMLNYEAMAAIYRQRRHHKLQEWHDFIDAMVELLPEPWIFTGDDA